MNGLLILLQLFATPAPQEVPPSAPRYGPRLLPAMDCPAHPADPRCRRLRLDLRLDPEAAPVDDPVARAMKDDWSRCGRSGMPVCPAKGRLILRAGM